MLIKLLPISMLGETEGVNYFVGDNLLRARVEEEYDVTYLSDLYHSAKVGNMVQMQGVSWFQYVTIYLLEHNTSAFYKLIENLIRQSSEVDVNLFFMKEDSKDDTRRILFYLFKMCGCENVIML